MSNWNRWCGISAAPVSMFSAYPAVMLPAKLVKYPTVSS
jgi:hypothetical protein